jgi:hypothetical protein
VVDRDAKVVSERLSAAAWDGYCGDPASWTEPLAALVLKGRLLWVLKNSVEDGYFYGLFNPNSNEPLELKGWFGDVRGTWARSTSHVARRT